MLRDGRIVYQQDSNAEETGGMKQAFQEALR
jgi:hypothetical protein